MSGGGSRFLALLSWLVPGARREEWKREWRAELAWRGGGLLGGAGALISAAEDAVGMRWRWWRSGGGDVRYGLRSLGRNPLFTAVVVATLAVGIGANGAIFSVVRGVLLRPLPYDHPEELAWVDLSFTGGHAIRSIAASGPEFLELRAENPAFAELAGFYRSDVNLGGAESPLRVSSAAVTANFLEVLGVAPALGRGFASDADRPGADDTVLLTHGLWTRAFAADPAVVGREIRINGRPARVIGVLPAGFHLAGTDVELLRPLTLDPADPGGRSSHYMSMLARLAPGLTPAAAQARTAGLVARWEAAYPGRHGPSADHPVNVTGLREAATGRVEGPLLLLMGAVVLVLLVACVNVGNLLVVRGETRQREVAVRSALGAPRAVITRQLVVEHMLLALAGGASGALVALAGIRLLPRLAPTALPGPDPVALDWTVLGFGLAITVGSGLLFGLVPAWLATRGDPVAALREGGRGATAGRRRLAGRRALVVLEVATAVMLLAGAAVLGRGFLRLLRVDPGFDSAGVVTVDFSLNSALYSREEVASFHAELARRLEALPGVEAAGAIRSLPLRGIGGWETFELIDRAFDPDTDDWTVQYQVAGPGFFEALRIPLRRGRMFDEGDDASSAPVALLNESAARQLFPDGAIGQRLRAGWSPDNATLTVVGVVGDVRQMGLDQEPTPQIYVPRGQAALTYGGLGSRLATLVVRGADDPGATIRAVRTVIRRMDPELPLAAVGTMDAALDRSLGDRRFLATLMAGFSVTALLLGALGLYGLLAYVVTRRRHEIGIRLTLGAERGRIVRAIVGEALALVLVGGAIGVAAALPASRLLEGLTFQVPVRDPIAFLVAPALLAVIALLAALPPARNAASVDPATTLREG